MGIIRLSLQCSAKDFHSLGRIFCHQGSAQAGIGPGCIRIGGYHMAEQGHLVLEQCSVARTKKTADK